MTDHDAGGSGTWDEAFNASLDRMTAIYGQLDALSSQQDALIDLEDADRLLAVLAERQNLIVELESVIPSFDRDRRLWDERASTLSEVKRTGFARRLSTLEKLAQTIADRDARTAALLAARKDAIASEISGVGRGSAAVNAYRVSGQSQRGPTFQDRKG
jgi:hypothetical protein